MSETIKKNGKNPVGITESYHLAWSKDKTGADVELRFCQDMESENRGFISHEASAWIDNKKAGYLLVSYVPKDRFKEFNPTIWNYATHFTGKLMVPFDYRSHDPFKLPQEEYEKFVSSAINYIAPLNTATDPTFLHDRKAFSNYLKSFRRYKELVKDRKDFINKLVDNPYVDFISTRTNERRGLMSDYMGRGIAPLLYIATAKEMDKMGLHLRSSSLQQPRAAEIWNKFSELGWTEPHGKTLKLKADVLPEISDHEAIFRQDKKSMLKI